MVTATAERPKTQLFTGGTTTAWAEARLGKLLAEDQQFQAALPEASVSEAKRQPGLRLAQIVQIVMEGYADRPAIGQRARTGRRSAQWPHGDKAQGPVRDLQLR